MTRHRKVVGVAILAVATLLLAQAPALARWHREAREGVNVLQVCPRYVTLEVASLGPVDGSTPPSFTVPVEAYTPPLTADSPLPPPADTNVLRRDLQVPLQPFEVVLDDEGTPTQFNYFGRFTLGWGGGQMLAPGTEVTIGVADTFVPGGQSEDAFETFTVPFAESGSCETPDLELRSVCSKGKKKLTWRVRNPNPFQVQFTWEVVGTDQSGSETVPANGRTSFKTRRVAGPNTTRLLVDGQEVDVEDACFRCPPGARQGS
jgi:hypothetical protein